MRAHHRLAVAGVAVVTGPLLAAVALTPPAAGVGSVAAAHGSGKAHEKAGKSHGDSKHGSNGDKKGDGKKGGHKKHRPRDHTPPARPVLGGVGLGAGGAVSLPVIAESGSRVVVSEPGYGTVAYGTGYGGYASVGWTASNGTHRYVVRAIDRSGNSSRPVSTTVRVDALPPRLKVLGTARGTSEDTRTTLRFGTEVGAAYRVFADGRPVAAGHTTRLRTEAKLDLRNGRHRLLLVVRDAVGNARSASRRVAVKVKDLDVAVKLTSDGSTKAQGLLVHTTPTATRGVVRVPGKQPVAFVVRGGSARTKVVLPDGTYDKGTVVVHDRWGRHGRAHLPAMTVDTTPPTLEVAPDAGAAADGKVVAAVTTDDGAVVRWRLVDRGGDVVERGRTTAENGTATVESDPDRGTYRLVVSAADGFGRTTTARSTSRVADDPWPVWLTAPLWTLLVAGLLAAAAGLVLLVRRVRDPEHPVRQSVAAAVEATRARVGALLGPVPEGDAAATVAALLEPDPEPEPAVARAPFMPAPRLRSRSGGRVPPDDQVFHRTPVRVYETAEEREDGPVLGSRTAELVLARDAIALVDDRTGDVWSGRIADLAHVGDDTTMVLPAGARQWIGLVYTDRDITRLALDLVAADQTELAGNPLTSAGSGSSGG